MLKQYQVGYIVIGAYGFYFKITSTKFIFIVRLYDQLHDLETKRDSLLEEMKLRGSPAEERERLLKQVKEDNQEIASIERQTRELQEKIEQMHEEIQQLDMDIEENQGKDK